MNERDTIPPAEKLAQFEGIAPGNYKNGHGQAVKIMGKVRAAGMTHLFWSLQGDWYTPEGFFTISGMVPERRSLRDIKEGK